MLQKENNDKKALYGDCLVGENWHFTTLYGNEYCIFRQYVATNSDDLQKIILYVIIFKTFDFK